MCRLNLYISFILQIHYSKLTFELIMKSEKIGEAKRKVELRMVAISSDSQNICEGPNQRQAFFFIAHICTSRASNPGLYRGRVLFYHQTTGASMVEALLTTILSICYYLTIITFSFSFYFLVLLNIAFLIPTQVSDQNFHLSNNYSYSFQFGQSSLLNDPSNSGKKRVVDQMFQYYWEL